MKKAAIVGTGFISETHVSTLKKLGIEIKTIIGNTSEKTAKLAEKHSISNYSTDLTTLDDKDIQYVHLCTPTGLHYEQIKYLLSIGKNILCEKPLTLTSSEAEELIEIANSKKLLCAVNLNVRYHPAVSEIKKIISSGELGNIRLVHGNYLQEFHILPVAYDWRYDEKTGGKMRATTEIGSHFFDLTEFLSGEDIVKVSALFKNYSKERFVKDGLMNEQCGDKLEVHSEDSVVVNFLLENGAIGSGVLSEVSHGRANHLSIELTGSKSSIWWNSENSTKLNRATKGTGVVSTLYPFGENGFSDTFYLLAKDYYNAVLNKAPINFPSFADGFKAVKISEALYESATNNGKWVAI